MFRLLAALIIFGHFFEHLHFIEGSTSVVGGTTATKNSWPSMMNCTCIVHGSQNFSNNDLPSRSKNYVFIQVSVQYKNGTNYYHTCGGTLIRTNRVITAAHCLKNGVIYRAVLGDHNYQQTDGTEQYIAVSKFLIHANYNPTDISAGYDIAIIYLAANATLNSYVKLAVLPIEGVILENNYPCIITGWGLTSTNGVLSPTLQQAPLNVVDYSTCSRTSYWGSKVKSTMICAGGDGVHSACNGDSGGPLNCAVNGTYQVHGVASFVASSGCNVYQKPSVFTRMSFYNTWIGTNI